MDEFRVQFQYKFHTCNTSNVQNVSDGLNKSDKIKMVFIQTPSYSKGYLSDIQSISDLCRTRNIKLVVDNTLASAMLQKPLILGADIVINQGDHIITGHDDLNLGTISVKEQSVHDRLYLISKSYGATTAPL